jgi:hypothetical protein
MVFYGFESASTIKTRDLMRMRKFMGERTFGPSGSPTIGPVEDL